MQPDLYDFVKAIKNKGYLAKLDTNGRDATIIKKLLDDNLLDYIAMDIKNPVESYEDLVWVKLDNDFFDNFHQSVELLKMSNIDYEFRTTVIKPHHTAKHIESIAKFLKWSSKYFLQNFKPEKTLDPNFIGQSFTEKELQEFQKIAENYVDFCGIRT